MFSGFAFLITIIFISKNYRHVHGIFPVKFQKELHQFHHKDENNTFTRPIINSMLDIISLLLNLLNSIHDSFVATEYKTNLCATRIINGNRLHALVKVTD